MPQSDQTKRWLQIAGWAIIGLFALGFFVPLLAAWTSAILAIWFVGTQKPKRGFLWLMMFAFIPSLFANWQQFPLNSAGQAPEYIVWMLLLALLTVLPFLFHRLVSPRLPGLPSTLPLPLSGAVVQTLAMLWLPATICTWSTNNAERNWLAHLENISQSAMGYRSSLRRKTSPGPTRNTTACMRLSAASTTTPSGCGLH